MYLTQQDVHKLVESQCSLAEESVMIGEVSLFQGLNCTQIGHLGEQKCPVLLGGVLSSGVLIRGVPAEFCNVTSSFACTHVHECGYEHLNEISGARGDG